MNAKLKGWILLIASLCLGLSAFLPYITVEVNMFGDVSEETSSLMPSIGGVIILIAALVSAAVPLVGLQKKAPIIGTLVGILSGGLLFRQYVSATTVTEAMNAYTGAFGQAMGGTATDIVTKVEFRFGFYFAIIAILAVVFSSFLYGLSDEY